MAIYVDSCKAQETIVITTRSSVYELVVLPPDLRAWKGLLPKDDQALKRELTHAFLSYLGVTMTPE